MPAYVKTEAEAQYEFRRQEYLARGGGNPLADFLIDYIETGLPTEEQLKESWDAGHEDGENEHRPCIDTARQLYHALEQLEEATPKVTEKLEVLAKSGRTFPGGASANYHVRDLQAEYERVQNAVTKIPWRQFEDWIQEYI